VEDHDDEDANDLIGSIVEVAEGVMVGKNNLLCEGTVRCNLLVMIWMWSATTFNLYNINFFLKYVDGGVFINFTMAGAAEIAANVFIGIMFPKFGVKWSFFIGYIVATAGGVCLIFMNKFADSAFLIAMFVLLAKFGISMA